MDVLKNKLTSTKKGIQLRLLLNNNFQTFLLFSVCTDTSLSIDAVCFQIEINILILDANC